MSSTITSARSTFPLESSPLFPPLESTHTLSWDGVKLEVSPSLSNQYFFFPTLEKAASLGKVFSKLLTISQFGTVKGGHNFSELDGFLGTDNLGLGGGNFTAEFNRKIALCAHRCLFVRDSGRACSFCNGLLKTIIVHGIIFSLQGLSLIMLLQWERADNAAGPFTLGRDPPIMQIIFLFTF